MPPQRANPSLESEEHTRDILVALGLRENISYRLTMPEREAMLTPGGSPAGHHMPYVEVINPTAPDKTVMRHTLLAMLLEAAAQNARYYDSQQLFEIGSVYLPREGQLLPDEPRRLAIVMTGRRHPPGWTNDVSEANMDYFDLKGVMEDLLDGLKIEQVSFSHTNHPTFHPGRSAMLKVGDQDIGMLGEVHPLVARAFDVPDAPVLAAELDLDSLLDSINYQFFALRPLPVTPPVYQDIALVIRNETTAAEVEIVIWKAGGDLLKGVRLFDVYAGDPIPAGHKSLAYSLTYQTDDRTLTDKEVASVHRKIVRAAEAQLGAQLRA
jgi:phenylalanyl-tRNA synthetase beta chain